MSDTIQLETNAGITILRLNRPPANAMDLALMTELCDALEQIGTSDARALIVTGNGGFFSAGLDLKAVPGYNADEQRGLVNGLNRMVATLYGMPLPTVAAVNGHAIAGGAILLLCCDYRVGAAGNYKIGLTEAKVGVTFPVGPLTVVQHELSAPSARVAVLLARNVPPQDAVSRGMLDELQPIENLLPKALEIAEEMASLPRQTYGRIKRQMRAAALAKIDDALTGGNEPLLQGWLSGEMVSASAEVLSSAKKPA